MRPLYWRERGGNIALGVTPDPDGGVTLQPGAQIAFDTYFNAFFERQWHAYSSVRGVRLQLELKGRAVLRLWRGALGERCHLLHEGVVNGSTGLHVPPAGTHFRQAGFIWFELAAIDGPVTLRAGSWGAPCVPARRVALGVVICTLNREPELGAVLSAIGGDSGLDEVVGRVIVVNQGRTGLRQRLPAAVLQLGRRLTIIEQANYGGAGGFGRGMLETLDDPAITHAVMLDDDVRLEPECLLRMGAFFSVARDNIALGGHMLDSVQPTCLYEAGARVQANGGLQPLRPADDLTKRLALHALLDTPGFHYNGWWMFGVDKSVIRRLGLPLPCFIRGDDVEFGLRLGAAGVATVGLPGVAIWHEPFYLKIGGWQLYYETRNAFIAMALHQGFGRRHVALAAFRQVMSYLLTFRYGSAALVIRGLQDFCRGPALLETAPASLHTEIVKLRAGFVENRTPADQALPEQAIRSSPRSRIGFVLEFARAVVRNWMAPSRPAAPPKRLLARDLVWFRMIDADCLAVDTYWDEQLMTYRRDRSAFRALFRSGVAVSLSLFRNADVLRAEWRRAAPALTSEGFWRDYLDVPAGRGGSTRDEEMILTDREHQHV